MTDEKTMPAQGGRGVSRRSVVRAGAHAAWAVPVISVATAAPAAASEIGQVLVTSFSVARNASAPTRLDVSLAFSPVVGIKTGSIVSVRIPKGTNSLATAPTLATGG